MEAAGLRTPARRMLAARWQLCACEPGAPRPGDQAGWIAADGPLTAAAALRQAGQWSLDGPARDFDAQDWWYVARFDAPEGARVLQFDGLATHVEGSLNGEPLFSHHNMFAPVRCDAGGLLRARDNELVLRFAALAPMLAQRRPRPRWRTPMVAHQQLRWHRTTLLGRTPGWSPPAAPVGPWRAIVWLDESVPVAQWQAEVEDEDGWIDLALGDAGGLRHLECAELVLRGGGTEHRHALTAATSRIRVRHVHRWWPHTHGEPVLYDAELRLQRRDRASVVRPLGRIGFREIAIDRTGGGFSLRVNGAPVFCRGAGWTPLDVVSLRSSREACHAAVQQARDAGFNMLRLAGMLCYEEDHFYELCDELGVLVWQDLMFASMDYPFEDEAFAGQVRQEVRGQLARLQRHPCLAVICGNSEVEQQAAMWGAPREQWHPRFFHEELPRLCGELAPQVPYWPSSAHGGAFPHQACEGTTSYYGVGAYERPLEDARRSGLKFATECLAFANVPAAATLSRMPGGESIRVHQPGWKERSPRDLGAGWDFDDVRDHYVQRLFDVDPARLRHADHERYLALGRQAVAEAMRAAYAEWRRPGSGCGGALLLFLRDLWAGAGWGVVDDQGLPKSALHALRSVLQPTAVFFTDEGGNGLAVHLVNERPEPRCVRLRLQAWRDGRTPVANGEKEMELPACGSQSLWATDLLPQFVDLNHAYRFGPPMADVLAATLLDGDGGELARAFHFPLGLATHAVPRCGLQLAARAEQQGHEGWLQVQSAALAFGVHFDLPGWVADDEHFHLAPGQARRIRLRRLREGAPLAGSVHALNLAGGIDVEAQP